MVGFDKRLGPENSVSRLNTVKRQESSGRPLCRFVGFEYIEQAGKFFGSLSGGGGVGVTGEVRAAVPDRSPGASCRTRCWLYTM